MTAGPIRPRAQRRSGGRAAAARHQGRRSIPAAPSCRTTSRRTCRSTGRSTLSRLRAWLHLLLRAADPRLSRPFAGARFRKQAVRQADAAKLLDQELRKPRLPAGRARARRRHRPLSADRAELSRITRAGAEGAERLQPPGRHHHQERAGAGRSRPARRHGEAQAVMVVDVGHHASTAISRASWSRAPRPRQPAGGDQAAERGRRAGRRSRSRRSSRRSPITRSKPSSRRRRRPAPSAVNWTLLRLPLEIKDLFIEWLFAHAPGKAKHAISLISQCHGGIAYRAEWGKRMRGEGPYADIIRERVEKAARRHGLDKREWNLDCARFAVPKAPDRQFELFC